VVRRTTERGFALLLALGISFLIAAIAIVIGRTLDTRSDTGLLELRIVKLRALTDAAMAEALAHLAQSPAYSGQPSHPLGDGTIGSSIVAQPDGTALVSATAQWHGWTATLKADVAFDGQGHPYVADWTRTLRVGADSASARSDTSHLD
jgi:hypothetical protein